MTNACIETNESAQCRAPCKACGRPFDVAVAPVQIDFGTGEATADGVTIKLVRRELSVLNALVNVYPGGIAKNSLWAAVYGVHPDSSSNVNSLDCTLSRLRAKMHEARWPYMIACKRFLGYSLHRFGGPA